MLLYSCLRFYRTHVQPWGSCDIIISCLFFVYFLSRWTISACSTSRYDSGSSVINSAQQVFALPPCAVLHVGAHPWAVPQDGLSFITYDFTSPSSFPTLAITSGSWDTLDSHARMPECRRRVLRHRVRTSRLSYFHLPIYAFRHGYGSSMMIQGRFPTTWLSHKSLLISAFTYPW